MGLEQLKFNFNISGFLEYAIIDEVLLILSCFNLFYLFVYIYLKVIFLRNVRNTPHEFPSLNSITHGHYHFTRVLHLPVNTSRCLATTPTSHNWQNMCGKPCYGLHFVTQGGVSNTNIICNVPRLPNPLVSYQGG